MIVELKGSDYYYVPMVDLRLHDSPITGPTSGTYVRSFSTSAEVFDWVRNHPGQVFRAVRHDIPGGLIKLPPSTDDYSLAIGDIIVGDLIVCDRYGLRKPGHAGGTG
jgi:hypothetical protein